MSSKYSIKCNFSARHKWQRSIFFPINFFHYRPYNTIKNHTYFNNSVFLLCCLWFKDFLWFWKRSSKVIAAIPKYILVSLLISFSTCALYIKFGVWHWFWRGQVFFTQELHPYLVISDWSSDLPGPTICDDILLMQL